MLNLTPGRGGKDPLSVLCIGAHSDDLEIGCAGTLLTWLQSHRPLHVTWVVLSAHGEREREARRSAKALLRGAQRIDLDFGAFRDGFLPSQYERVKEFFEEIKSRSTVDVVFTHRLEDRHQDHRMAAELTWNTWRDHLVLEYEIPKYEGDLGLPNVYVPLSKAVERRKEAHLERHFGTQRSKGWFSRETFAGLARLRGVECRSPSGYAEAFHGRKLTLSPTLS
jgi:LmbE family N-acetylglucosaminyl deacetylase